MRHLTAHHRTNGLVFGHLSNGVVEPWSEDATREFLVSALASERKKWGAEILAGEREKTLRLVLEKIPKANNPANALMDEYREGQNSGYKQVRMLLESLLAPEEQEKKI